MLQSQYWRAPHSSLFSLNMDRNSGYSSHSFLLLYIRIAPDPTADLSYAQFRDVARASPIQPPLPLRRPRMLTVNEDSQRRAGASSLSTLSLLSLCGTPVSQPVIFAGGETGELSLHLKSLDIEALHEALRALVRKLQV